MSSRCLQDALFGPDPVPLAVSLLTPQWTGLQVRNVFLQKYIFHRVITFSVPAPHPKSERLKAMVLKTSDKSKFFLKKKVLIIIPLLLGLEGISC